MRSITCDHVHNGCAAQNHPAAALTARWRAVVRLRAAFCLTCCAGLLFAGARRTVQSGRDRPLGSLIRRCSARRDLWNKVPSPARTRPASARADALTARGCSHRHWIGRRRGGHHHVHNPPWPPPPRASAAKTAAPRRTASHCTASRPEWHVQRRLCSCTGPHTAQRSRDGDGRERSVVALSPFHILKCVQICHAVIWL